MRTSRTMMVVGAILVLLPVAVGGFALAKRQSLLRHGPEVADEKQPVERLQVRLEAVQGELEQALEALNHVFGHPVEPGSLQSLAVTVTAYSSTRDQCDSTPFIAANNEPVRVGTLAVSRDLQREFGIAYGQRVLIPGYGLFEVCDTMNPRWQRRVDIWESNRQAARMFGKRQGRLIWIPPAQQEQLVTVARNE